MFTEASIPTIRLTDADLIDRLSMACQKSGMFYLKDPRFSDAQIGDYFSIVHDFFEQPSEDKQSWKKYWPLDARLRLGYVPTQEGAFLEHKESISVFPMGCSEEKNWEKIVGDSLENLPCRGKPSTVTDVLHNTYGDFDLTARYLFELLAAALDLKEDFFSSTHGENFVLRSIHYPELEEGQVAMERVPGHVDYSTMTMMIQDQQGGLEVEHDGEWLAVPPRTDAILVWFGEFMQRWTNDVVKSTRHRVVVPDGCKGSRMSTVFFCDPNPDAVVTAAESFVREGSHYQSVKVADYIDSLYTTK